ncbi:MFS transporter [Cohnella lupini]|uniref:GPH family glycoside/pentoside/hexuronide:cation symporter n=1 Tax=Cohnella lupini TaxID=1294267 RepID=A0A3D9I975_9BACL|nr:MFS transporter [Cohnella lupini]RED58099.1 GPH family glycoside/pentoside/hexuronide:cation symporter [Cohnella lupini]
MRQRFLNSPMMYAFGMLAMMIPSQAFSSFYSYYYVDKLGLSIGLATLARTIFLIWDAVNQPLFGYWSDRTNTKYGRRRPWIFGAIPFFMLSFILVFSPPQGLSEMGLFTWFLIALVIYEAVATVIWVNYGALFPELFKGDRLRAKASAVQQGYQIVALLIGTALTPILFDAMGFGKMSIIYALVFGVLMLIFLRNVKEDEQAMLSPQLGFKEAFRETFKNKTFWLVNIANSFAQTVNGLLSSMIPFYAKYVLKVPEAQNAILLGSIFVSVIPLVAVWFWLIRRLDPVKGWRLSFVAYALSVIPLWFGTSLVSGIIAGVLVGFGLAGFLVTPPIVNSIIIDQDFAKTGSRREGIYTAVSGFITRSSGLISALAFLIVGIIFGYEDGDNPGPDPESTFRYLISVVPFGLLVVSIFLSFFVKIERKPADES